MHFNNLPALYVGMFLMLCTAHAYHLTHYLRANKSQALICLTMTPFALYAWHAISRNQEVIQWPLLQAAEQAQKLREARKEKADMEGNVNDMERAQDFLKAGNVKVKDILCPSPLPPSPSHPFPCPLYWLQQK